MNKSISISKDIEKYLRACDASQRVGKPHVKTKAPLKLVPLIAEPFLRLRIDIVGPLAMTKAGHRYPRTVVCPATKFPEAIAIKEHSSREVDNALLSILSRIGFPQEVDSAFRDLKTELSSYPVLRAPSHDRSFIVLCEASKRGLGVIICSQYGNGMN